MLFRTLLRMTKKLGACHIHLQMEAAFGKVALDERAQQCIPLFSGNVLLADKEHQGIAVGKAVMSDMGGRIQHRCNALSAADIRGHFL